MAHGALALGAYHMLSPWRAVRIDAREKYQAEHPRETHEVVVVEGSDQHIRKKPRGTDATKSWTDFVRIVNKSTHTLRPTSVEWQAMVDSEKSSYGQEAEPVKRARTGGCLIRYFLLSLLCFILFVITIITIIIVTTVTKLITINY